jgi:hypothetical protein
VRAALAAAAVLTLLSTVSTGILSAAPDPQDQLYQITSPRPNAEVRGSVEIVGSARLGPEFQFYKVEYAASGTPDAWVPIGQLHYEQKGNERLEVWHTTTLPDGAYYLRLIVVRQDGNYMATEPLRVTVANTEPAPTPTPEESPTPTATVVIPTPTTAVVEQPTAVPRATSTPGEEIEVTPTVASEEGATVPIPSVGACARQFVFGAFVAVVLFVFAGVVLLLRRFI